MTANNAEKPPRADDGELRRVLLAARKHQVQLEELRARIQEPIAIIGWAARTPFESADVGMWEGLAGGVDASSETPKNRWDADAIYDPDPRAAGKTPVRRGSFLANIEDFDARFFGLSPVEADGMDPRQRLVLELAWEALANAGVSLRAAQSLQTGVYIGASGNEYASLVWERLRESDDPLVLNALGAGSIPTMLAGRVSHALGLGGPSLVTDAGCTASLLSVHLACESLRVGTADLALAGGVHVNLLASTLVLESKSGMLSGDGRCRSFDASGAGFGRGEGCGIVVLKRLSDALRDRDRIHALVRGSAYNHVGGTSNGLAAPSGPAQARVIRAALEFAKLSPADVQYIEAHGTGTALGDSIEVEALVDVFGGAHSREAPLAIGSVKSNIGHLEEAAAVVGLIKAVLCIEQRRLPPSLHYEKPNPHVPWDRIPIRVQTELGPWPQSEKPLVAGVSSFSMIGTNAHVVVSEAPPRPAESWQDADREAAEAHALPLCISAKTPEALRAYAERYAKYLQAPRQGGETWRDIAWTSCERATHHEQRLVTVGSNPADWAARLQAFSEGSGCKGIQSGRAAPHRKGAVFVFSGLGSEWWGMGRELLARESSFQRAIAECESCVSEHGRFSLLEELQRSEASTRLDRADVAHAALVALQIGLVRLFAAWGIEPAAVVGHGVGEISAAFCAGALTLEQACRFALLRGRAVGTVTDAKGDRSSLKPSPPRLPIVSTLTGTIATKGFDADYWMTQMQRPALFAEATQTLLDQEHDLFLEVGPDPTLLASIEEIASRARKAPALVSTLRRNENQLECALESFGALHCTGFPVDWKKLFLVPGRVVTLPPYPWQRQRHWL